MNESNEELIQAVEKDRVEDLQRRKRLCDDLLELTKPHAFTGVPPFNRSHSIISAFNGADKNYSGKFHLNVDYCNTYFNDSEALMLRDWLNSKIETEKNYCDNKKIIGKGFVCVFTDNCMKVFTEKINYQHYNLLRKDLNDHENTIFFTGDIIEFHENKEHQ